MVSFPEILDHHPKWEESVVAYDNRTLSRRGPVKMAGYWPSLLCIVLPFVLPSTSCWSTKNAQVHLANIQPS